MAPFDAGGVRAFDGQAILWRRATPAEFADFERTNGPGARRVDVTATTTCGRS